MNLDISGIKIKTMAKTIKTVHQDEKLNTYIKEELAIQRTEDGNVAIDLSTHQICVLPATIVESGDVESFEDFFKDFYGVEVKYLESIRTKPDINKEGQEVEGTGGRIDVFFAVNTNQEKFTSFCVRRLSAGIRWIEDVMGEWNEYDSNPIYPERVRKYCTW